MASTSTMNIRLHQRLPTSSTTSQHHEEDHQRYAEAFLSNWFNANSFHTVRVKNGYDGNNNNGSESFREFDEPLNESLRSCVSSISLMVEAQAQDREEDVNGEDYVEEYEDDDANEFNASHNTFCRPCNSKNEDRNMSNNNNESASSNGSSSSGSSMIISLDHQSKEDGNPDMHNTGLPVVSELDAIDRALRYSIQRKSSHALAPAPDKQTTSFRAPDKQISFHAPAQKSWSRRKSNSLVILPTLSQRRENMGTSSQRTNAQTTAANNMRRKTKRQVVSRLPWRDDRGTLGHYTGQVNERRQPHGSGALIYEGGAAKTSIWQNGTPIRFWIPGEKKKKEKKRSSGVSMKQMSNSNRNAISNFDRSTFLPHLDIGDAGTTRDMVLFEYTPSIALKIMNSLRLHDFAFIQRSSGQWTYAIIAEKREDAIRFVVNVNGDTKTLSEKRWYTSIRWVNPEEAC